MTKRIITIEIDFNEESDVADAIMVIVDEKGSDRFADPSLRWIAMARVLSRFSTQCLDKAASAVREDEKKYFELDAKNNGGEK